MNRSLLKELIREEYLPMFEDQLRTLEREKNQCEELVEEKKDIIANHDWWEIDPSERAELKKLELEQKFLNRQVNSMVNLVEPTFHTITVQCKKKLSPTARNIVLSWNPKRFYHANEDVLYLCRSNPIEQDFLLKTLHSIAIFLQNATCTNFFAIKIHQVIITPTKSNKSSRKSEGVETLTFKLSCRTTLPPKKLEILW